MLLPLWLMLLPLFCRLDYTVLVADVIATSIMIDWLILLPRWLMLLPLSLGCWLMFFAMVVDVKTTQGRMFYGRCYGHLWLMLLHTWSAFILSLVLRCCTEPHPIYVADGICQYSCLGMDYWPLCTGLLLWSLRGCGPLSPVW